MSPHRFVVSSALALILSCCTASGQEQVPYSQAEFQIPTDPTRAVLHIRTSAMNGTIRSLTLYSDGRLEMSDNRSGKFERQLEFAEIGTVLSNAITHGLAEWDTIAIRGKKLEKDGDNRTPEPEDGLRITVLIGVDHYRRGFIEIDRLERSISLRGPGLAARRYPGIPQFQGLVTLLDWMTQQLDAAQKSTAQEKR